MFDVAFSRLICYSLVYIAILKAKLFYESLDIPMILPGIFRFKESITEKNAAWGPPNPNGTPNLYEVPIEQ